MVSPEHLQPTRRKLLAEVGAEWDQLADERFRQTAGGADISFRYVVAPAVLELSGREAGNVIDAGCGVGALTRQLAVHATSVLGVDVSRRSIHLARAQNQAPNIEYVASSIEEVAQSNGPAFDLAVASMSLMVTPDLDPTVEALASVLRSGGRFVFAITHPCFWPSYWGYDRLDWFAYGKEIFIEAAFTTSLLRSKHLSTHVHRPLNQYFNSFARAGLSIIRLVEPMPAGDARELYPVAWEYPRFLVGELAKTDPTADTAD